MTTSRERSVRTAPFALRIFQRREGMAAVVYRRRVNGAGRDRLERLAGLSPIAYTAGLGLLREAVAAYPTPGKPPSPRQGKAGRAEPARGEALQPGPSYPLDGDWGARIACYALVAHRLRNGERLLRAADHLRYADANEAAWWLGLLTRSEGIRALRALRILVEAVE